jgi:tetratricopeptide (TPR) repeat protein
VSAGRRRSVLPAALLLAAALLPLPARPAAAADPFYLGLLRDGNAAYDRKDYPRAAHDLRLACFGLLDEPAPLGDCLVRLAAAQGAAGDNDGFLATFGRLAEVEERFGIYGRLALPPELRAAFEERAAATVPLSTLAAVPSFAPLASRRAEARWRALPPKERRKELEARLAKEPRDPVANRLLAELDFAEGKTKEALARAERAAAIAPQDPGALCLRGLTRAWARRCKDAVPDLGPCPRSLREPRYATALLGCWVELGEWREAEGVVASLPAELKEDRPIAALVARVQQHAAERPRAAGLPPPAGGVPARPAAAGADPPKPAPPPPLPARPAAGTGGAAALSSGERASLERSRSLLKSARTPDLKQAFDLARQVADAHPELREAQLLAGETAYRNSRWREAAAFLQRGGELPEDRPELLFYLAVSLYESGDAPAAATALRRSLPRLQKTPYVELYTRRILGTGNGR